MGVEGNKAECWCTGLVMASMLVSGWRSGKGQNVSVVGWMEVRDRMSVLN